MVSTEKILETMNSWHWWELIVECSKRCFGGSSRSNSLICSWSRLTSSTVYCFLQEPSPNVVRHIFTSMSKLSSTSGLLSPFAHGARLGLGHADKWTGEICQLRWPALRSWHGGRVAAAKLAHTRHYQVNSLSTPTLKIQHFQLDIVFFNAWQQHFSEWNG